MKDYIGVDIGKFELDVFNGTTFIKFNNTDKGINEFILYLKDLEKSALFVLFEATGGYEKRLEKLLHEAKIDFQRVHPNKVRHFAKSQGYLAKTDKLDAEILFRYGRSNNLEISDVLLDEKTAELKALLVRREQLIDEKVREANRIDKLADKVIIDSITSHVNWIEEELHRIEEKIKDHINQNPMLKEKTDLFKSIKGIGFLTAAYLATLPELGKVENAQISSLVGVAPMNCDSGKKKGKRSIQAGRARIRKVLYMAALSAIRSNPNIKAFYCRLIQRGKLFKVAITAVIRKLIILANSIAKRRTPWVASLEIS